MTTRFDTRMNNNLIENNYYKKEEELKKIKVNNLIEQYFEVEFEITINNVISNNSNLFFKYEIVSGDDWKLTEGNQSGISQKAFLNPYNNNKKLNFNFPICVVFDSSNIQGWPNLVVTLYEISFWGNSYVVGYGCIKLPISNGMHERNLKLFCPKPCSYFEYFIGFLNNKKDVTFKQPHKVLAKNNEGRELTRNDSIGEMNIHVMVKNKELEKFGFNL